MDVGQRVFLDAYLALILEVDGDATPLGQCLLCVLLVVYRLTSHARSGFVLGCLPQSTALEGGAVRLRLGVLRRLILRKWCPAWPTGTSFCC